MIQQTLVFLTTLLVLTTHAFAGANNLYPISKPNIKSGSAIVMDAKTGMVLYDFNVHTIRYPASTTKILTALLLIENCDPSEYISAPHECETIEGSSLYLKPTERVKAEDMLYALMLRSANDVAYAIACHISGSVEEFAKLMNERAKQIGCVNSHFTNPHGLPDENHFSTAYDLALIAREAMNYSLFAEVAKTQSKVINRSLNTLDVYIRNKNRFLADENAEGIKTGYTKSAGHCFVGAKVHNNWRLITVVLNSQDWLADTSELFNWAFENFEMVNVLRKGDLTKRVKVIGGKEENVQAMANDDLTVVLAKGEFPGEIQYQFDSLEAPIQKGQKIGFAVYIAGDTTFQVPLIASQTVEKLPLLASTKFILPMVLLSILAISSVGFLTYLFLKRNNV